MADSDHSSHDATTSVDSRGDNNNSQDPKLLDFSEDEETLIARMYTLVGQRWSLIAGRIPGRTAEEIEKYWTSRCSEWRMNRET
ncbi:MYB-like transcription factor ETC3 [Rhodamnia argentea]|uniref:MYB-like transcription factor ETC3 n=1 Tax=Rhodamnia argentea TaxID=178133 RepID=A0A8B8QDQ5_9MYRT|nr:MYB-like transcription factor ETC3 [Rhodamnia argentea]